MMLQKIRGFDFFPKLMIHDIEFNLQVCIILENKSNFSITLSKSFLWEFKVLPSNLVALFWPALPSHLPSLLPSPSLLSLPCLFFSSLSFFSIPFLFWAMGQGLGYSRPPLNSKSSHVSPPRAWGFASPRSVFSKASKGWWLGLLLLWSGADFLQ